MYARRLRPLVEAFVWPLLFFDRCDEETLDLDVCVQQMENISTSLDALDVADRLVVMQVLKDIAQDEWRPDIRTFIEDIPRDLGWLDEEEKHSSGHSQP